MVFMMCIFNNSLPSEAKTHSCILRVAKSYLPLVDLVMPSSLI
ncbi:hypothetical protein RINTHM_9310 [Richelia intracellularis HM01]|nr:hypothetical protein RINTHM_9310 [Richelia intracellularis HM01]